MTLRAATSQFKGHPGLRGGAVVDLPVQCGEEGVQAGQHGRILGTLTVFPQPGFGISRPLLTICRAAAR